MVSTMTIYLSGILQLADLILSVIWLGPHHSFVEWWVSPRRIVLVLQRLGFGEKEPTGSRITMKV